jgi:hypothetical protein
MRRYIGLTSGSDASCHVRLSVGCTTNMSESKFSAQTATPLNRQEKINGIEHFAPYRSASRLSPGGLTLWLTYLRRTTVRVLKLPPAEPIIRGIVAAAAQFLE